MQELEPRWLLSRGAPLDSAYTDLSFNDGILTLAAKNPADAAKDEVVQFLIERSPLTEALTVYVTCSINGRSITGNFNPERFPGLRGFRFDGHGGNDRICVGQWDSAIELPFGVTLHGGAGDDVLLGGAGDDVLIGGMGEDRVRGGKGADYLEGEWGFTPFNSNFDRSFFRNWSGISEQQLFGTRYIHNPLEQDPADLTLPPWQAVRQWQKPRPPVDEGPRRSDLWARKTQPPARDAPGLDSVIAGIRQRVQSATAARRR